MSDTRKAKVASANILTPIGLVYDLAELQLDTDGTQLPAVYRNYRLAWLSSFQKLLDSGKSVDEALNHLIKRNYSDQTRRLQSLYVGMINKPAGKPDLTDEQVKQVLAAQQRAKTMIDSAGPIESASQGVQEVPRIVGEHPIVTLIRNNFGAHPDPEAVPNNTGRQVAA